MFIFTLIALAHEGGHFFAAKKAGMKVLEFGVGFGPRIFAKEINGTIFSINLIPILAFVSLAGMDESKDIDVNSIPQNERYESKTPLQKISMAFMGPFMNIVLAFVILSFTFAIFGMPKSLSNYVGQVSPKSVAEKSGLKQNDQIIELNGKKNILMPEIIEKIHSSKDKELTFKVLRDGKEVSIKATPKYNEKLKLAVIGFTPKPVYESVNPFMAIVYGAQQTFGMIVMTFFVLAKLITGGISLGDLAGPVGIAQVTGRYAETGIISFLTFFAFLNVNIGVLNLLPLPALDGGHIIFALIEWITRRPVSEKIQKVITQWGMILLLTLMALVTVNDLFRLFR